MKKVLLILLCSLLVTSMYAQKVNFTVTSNGSFVNAENRNSYAILSVPGMSAEELYYAFLITLRNKCVNSSGQMDVVENKAINLYDFESNLKVGSIWTASFDGYVYYRLLLQFKDGMVRIESPIVSRFGKNGTTYHYTFEYMLQVLQLFKEDGSPRKEKHIITINNNINDELNSIIDTALNVYKW